VAWICVSRRCEGEPNLCGSAQAEAEAEKLDHSHHQRAGQLHEELLPGQNRRDVLDDLARC
jgi:hypothetical protein